ncbi:hypothetical protein BGZ97_013365 [Linnemannia gamsii]|jgi:L-ascorbate metabolism protein UlaG (beta-lactamase superfamily)|uniref:Metallo-beta-lactamase domain-containing protein n=1 Tax=Linnemannia gamsii TaxID=64522 RepID=A0A9P6R405_9FUNG|nr:hypothetical protein BGZ97_013365 [Linnemannia gamsii]
MEIPTTQSVKIQLIRNASLKITCGDKVFLVDPMLAKKGAYPGFEGTFRSHLRNPMIDLPMPVEDVMEGVDAVIVSHTHLDHWDEAAQELLRKDLPLFAQDEADAQIIRGQGFTDVRILGADVIFEGVHLTKTGGLHGTDSMFSVPQLAEILGKVMGIVFQAPGSKTVYVAGDTVWDKEVDETLAKFNPDVIILNTGDARLDGFSDPIIMSKDDTLHAHQAAPNATIIAVHMDAINHTALSRQELREYVQQKDIQDHVLIPDDGEILQF